MTVVWRKRRGRCLEVLCPVTSFTEHDERVAVSRALMTTRARWWAIEQIRREHASVAGLARQLGCSWSTVWSAGEPILARLAADEPWFAGVDRLGVDEHVWHHRSQRPADQGGRGSKFFTGMVDLTPKNKSGRGTRLLDLSQGRSGKVYADWLTARGDDFRAGVQEATLDPFHGYKNAIDEHLDDATAVIDAFHVVKLANQAVDGVGRRPTGHPGTSRQEGRPLVRDPHQIAIRR